jgi:hypothetical protein
MPQISLLTLPIIPLQPLVQIISMDNSIKRCPKIYTSKQGSKVLNHQRRSKSQHNHSPQIDLLTSAGPPWPSSTRTSFCICGHLARNLMQISLATWRLSHRASIWVHHPWHQSTQPQRFLPPMFWLSKSLLVQINFSSYWLGWRLRVVLGACSIQCYCVPILLQPNERLLSCKLLPSSSLGLPL